MDPSTSHDNTLRIFELPLSKYGPPVGFDWEQRETSVLSSTTAFDTGIDARDCFSGVPRCIVCGNGDDLEHCHVIMQSQPQVWKDLQVAYHWIPSQAKRLPNHEPRNGLLMCPNHHKAFDAYRFFIRYIPDTKKYVFINYSGSTDNEEYHGRAVALDTAHRHAPFPSLFIIHEMRVRGHNPFQPTTPTLLYEIRFQKWIENGSLFDNEKKTFIREKPPTGGGSRHVERQPPATGTASGPSGGRTLAMNPDVVNEILAATRAMPSWKACQVEGTDWTGTAEENIRKYTSLVGTQFQDN